VLQVGRHFKGEARRSGSQYFLTIHTYRKLASLAVATSRPAFRVARFGAERTFALLSANSAKGTLKGRTLLQCVEIPEDCGNNLLVFPASPLREVHLEHRLEMGWSFVGPTIHTYLFDS
jgi:hypothetical protein